LCAQQTSGSYSRVRPRSRSPTLSREQPVEEGAVAHQRHPQILGRDVVSLRPLLFKPFSFARKAAGDPLHEVGDKGVGCLD
jgi:hypothetical protein